MISIQLNKNTQILINTKNMLKFNILYDVKRENITLQLENILKTEKIKMVDSKITDFLILSIKKQDTYNRKRKMRIKIIDDFKIEGLQNFNQYLKINPIAIQIVESEIQNCCFILKIINTDLLLIAYYLVHLYKKTQM